MAQERVREDEDVETRRGGSEPPSNRVARGVRGSSARGKACTLPRNRPEEA